MKHEMKIVSWKKICKINCLISHTVKLNKFVYFTDFYGHGYGTL